MSSIYYASAAALVVASLYRPFITKLDMIKYIILGSIASTIPYLMSGNPEVTYMSSPTNSYENMTLTPQHSVNSITNATQFQVSRSSTADKYLYIDATVYFLISTLVISINGLFTRWHFTALFIKPNANTFVTALTRNGLSTLFVLLAIMGSQTSLNHMLSLSLTVIGALWYISGAYVIRRSRSITASHMVSSALAYAICYTAPNQGSGQVFMLVSTLVLACNTLDYLDAVMNMYPYLVNSDKSEQSKFQDALSLSYWASMLRLVCNMPSESELNPSPIQDLETAIRVLGPASRSWKTMAALFPVNLRQDLCLLYAFFRTADDLVDDAPTPEQCAANLVTIRKFLRDVFLPSSNSNKIPNEDTSLPANIDWNFYAALLPNEDFLAIFRNFARIAHYLCPRAMSELTDAWELDLRGAPVKKQKDLLNYAALISGTFGELCTCVIMYKTGRGNWSNSQSRDDEVLSRARSTGQCLQLINIARDIIADSLVGRCYVPLQYMRSPKIYQLLKVARTPMQVGETTLKSYSLRILSLADQISDKAQKGIDGLPSEVQDSIRAAFEIYMAIGPTLREDPGFPLRAKVPKSQQQWIALRCIYGFRGPVARALISTAYGANSVYVRTFARIFNSRSGPKTH